MAPTRLPDGIPHPEELEQQSNVNGKRVLQDETKPRVEPTEGSHNNPIPPTAMDTKERAFKKVKHDTNTESMGNESVVGDVKEELWKAKTVILQKDMKLHEKDLKLQEKEKKLFEVEGVNNVRMLRVESEHNAEVLRLEGEHNTEALRLNNDHGAQMLRLQGLKDIEIFRHQDTILELRGTILELKKDNSQLKNDNYQLKDKYCELKLENGEVKAEVQRLKGQIQHRPHSQGYQYPTNPTLLPDNDPAVRDNQNYLHRNAPRPARMFKHFHAKYTYGEYEGKVAPSDYGSNANWDLGLCKTHFRTKDRCRHGRNCEFRHEPLSQDEATYMKRLGSLGLNFYGRIMQNTFRKS